MYRELVSLTGPLSSICIIVKKDGVKVVTSYLGLKFDHSMEWYEAKSESKKALEKNRLFFIS